MKKRFKESQIVFAFRQAASGTAVSEITRKMEVSGPTFCRWKKLYGGLGVNEIPGLKLLEGENRKPKKMVADLELDDQMFQDVLSKTLEGLPFGANWHERSS